MRPIEAHCDGRGGGKGEGSVFRAEGSVGLVQKELGVCERGAHAKEKEKESEKEKEKETKVARKVQFGHEVASAVSLLGVYGSVALLNWILR